MVLVQSADGLPLDDPAFQQPRSPMSSRDCAGVPHVSDVSSPLSADGADQVSADESSALVEFELRGTDEQMADRVEAPLNAVAEAQDAHPEL